MCKFFIGYRIIFSDTIELSKPSVVTCCVLIGVNSPSNVIVDLYLTWLINSSNVLFFTESPDIDVNLSPTVMPLFIFPTFVTTATSSLSF